LNRITPLLLGLAGAAITLWSFEVPDAEGFQRPELARIFFWHFPCPILMTGLMIVGAYFGWRVLRSTTEPDRRAWDVRSVAALELGLVFCLLTMASGILFSRVQWGTWWQWDPRQSSFLLAMLLYGAYFALRGAIAEPGRRAGYAAAYILAAQLPLVFLIYVYPRLPQVQRTSFHPTESIMQGQIKGPYAQVVVAVLVLCTVLSLVLYQMRVRAGELELRLETYGNLETRRRHTADPPVVRPIRLSPERTEEA